MNRFGRWMIYALAGIAFLAPLKFGTPVVLESLAPPPVGFIEWLFFSWPNQLSVLLPVGALSWMLADQQRTSARIDFLWALPMVFLLTQAIALPGAINVTIAVATVLHFAVCVLLFYAAAWYLRDGAAVEKVFAGLGLASFLVCVFAMEQWWSGLEATRAMVAEMNTRGDTPSPELLARLQSHRVFATLVYPNALAGYLVVAVAPLLAWVWVRGRMWSRPVKWGTLVLVTGVMLFCLVLTGSRGGFLAFVVAAVTVVWCCCGRQRKGILAGVLIVSGAVFTIGVTSGRIHLGGSSLGARFDYWHGAVQIIRDHPWQGSGPGTFGSIYPKYKQGETEEAQVAHNHYLQMWSDSGVVAFTVFALLWIVAARDALRLVRNRPGDAAAIGICAALMGWAVHGLVDFDLYVPGVAFPVFILLGALQGLKEGPHDKGRAPLARLPRVGWLAAALVVLGVGWVSGRSLLASWYHGRALRQEDSNPAVAQASLQRARALAPGNSHYLLSSADLAWQLGNREQARAFCRAAIEHDPYRPSYHWRLFTLAGATPEGLAALRRAIELNPTREEYRVALEQLEESVRQGGVGLLESPPTNQSPRPEQAGGLDRGLPTP